TSAVTLALLEFDDDAWEQVISREVACQDLNMLATGRLTLLPSATSRVVQFTESERPHYWYFQFVSLPDCSVPVSATYTVTFLQADGSQLSYDAKGMPATAAVFFTMYLIFMAVLGFVYFFRSRPPFVPRLVKLLLLAVLLYTFAIMFSLIHFSKEDVDGEATSGSLVMYSLCSLSAYLTLWALAVYAAGGLGITKPNWSWKENIPFISMYTTLLVTCLALVIVLFADYEPMEPNFVVNMWPRIVLVVASILFGLFWCIRMRHTYMTEARVDKRKALRTLFIVLGVQFLIQPVFEIIAAASPEYERLRVAGTYCCYPRARAHAHSACVCVCVCARAHGRTLDFPNGVRVLLPTLQPALSFSSCCACSFPSRTRCGRLVWRTRSRTLSTGLTAVAPSSPWMTMTLSPASRRATRTWPWSPPRRQSLACLHPPLRTPCKRGRARSRRLCVLAKKVWRRPIVCTRARCAPVAGTSAVCGRGFNTSTRHTGTRAHVHVRISA
ncbi:hypothetical protein EON62_04010, partial [archaeon]